MSGRRCVSVRAIRDAPFVRGAPCAHAHRHCMLHACTRRASLFARISGMLSPRAPHTRCLCLLFLFLGGGASE
jgi:hypothetical protein